MPIIIACGACQQRLKVGDELAGKRVRCSKCQSVLVVPAAATERPSEHKQERGEAPRRQDSSVRRSPASSAGTGADDVTSPLQSKSAKREMREAFERARSHRPARGSSNSSKLWLIIGGIAAFAVLSGCGMIALLVWFIWPPKPINTVSAPPPPIQKALPPSKPPAPESQKKQDRQIEPKKEPAFEPKKELDPLRHQGKDRVYVKEAGFSIVAPAGWSTATQDANPVFRATGPIALFTPNLSVNITRNHDGTSPEQMLPLIRRQMPSQFQGWKELESKTLTINNMEAGYILSQLSIPAGDRLVQVKMLQYFYVGNNNNFYVLSCGAGVDNFAAFRKAFEDTAFSFQTDD